VSSSRARRTICRAKQQQEEEYDLVTRWVGKIFGKAAVGECWGQVAVGVEGCCHGCSVMMPARSLTSSSNRVAVLLNVL
jgi:hypothetical protein